MAADEEHTEDRRGSCVIQPCKRDPLPDLEPVCGPHRSKVRNQLREIPDFYAELEDPPATPPNERSEDLHFPAGHERAGQVVPLASEPMPAATVGGKSNAPRVSGSLERPVPLKVDRHDLLSPARDIRLTKAYPGQLDDQVGLLPAAQVLDLWCRDFAELRREWGPAPEVADQCRWLLDRWDWACSDHPAVDEFAKEVGDLHATLRRAAGRTEPKKEHCAGIPCRNLDCDLKTLWRLPSSDYIECESCGALLTEAEYQDWLKLLRAPLCARRNGDWWCALPRRHDGGCAPAMVEDETEDLAA